MFTIKNIIIGILTFFTVLILVYSSYFYSAINKNFTFPHLQNKQVGTYQFHIENGAPIESESGEIRLKQIHALDAIYSTVEGEIIEKNNIDLSQDGSYFIQILSDENYTISGKGYTFSISHPANILVSTLEDQTMIFPLTTKISIDVLDIETKTVENNIVLYPHEYIVFKPKLNKLISKADVSRVQQIFNISYNGARLKSGSTINPDFLQQLDRISDTQKNDIKNIIQVYLQEQLSKHIAINDFLEQKFISISGQDLIEKYFMFFLNPEKKKAYYKNKILADFSNILTTKASTNPGDKIRSNLHSLKSISDVEHTQLLTLLQEYLINYIATSRDDKEKKGAMYDLFLELSGSSHTIDKDIFASYNTFIAYDLYNSKENLHTLIHTYTEHLAKQSHERSSTGYIVYYLNEVLLGSFSQLSNGNAKEIEDILGIFNTYVTLSKDYYKAENLKNLELQGKMRQTGVKEYGLLLDKIGNSFQEIFFEKNRDEVGRLIKKDTNTLDKKTISIFEKNINGLQNFYQKYNKYLTDSRINILNRKRFSNAKKNFQEYLSALKDYDKYLSENDKKNSVFLGGREKQEEAPLSPDYVKKLFGVFYHIDLSRAEIESKNIGYCIAPTSGQNDGEPYCYQINNIRVGNRFFNFILIPGEGNKITNIFLNINQTPIKIENEVEIKIDTIKKQFTNDSYKMFLANTFNKFIETSKNNTTTANTVDISTVFSDEQGEKNENLHEQELLRTVKNTLLLGDKGVFMQVKKFLDVKYNNIAIQTSEKTKEYDIYLSNVELNYNSAEKNSITGRLESSFMFTVKGTSSFRNPKINISSSNHSLGFSNYNYEIIGTVPIGEMETHISTIANINNNILASVGLIHKKLGPNSLNIKYYLKQKTLLVYYGDVRISINPSSKLIKKMHYKGKNYLTKLVSFDNLETYINSLP